MTRSEALDKAAACVDKAEDVVKDMSLHDETSARRAELYLEAASRYTALAALLD